MDPIAAPRFGQRILIKRKTPDEVFNVILRYTSEMVMEEDPSTWAQPLESKVQPLKDQGIYVGGLLTGPDLDEYAQKEQAILDQQPDLSHLGVVHALQALDETYFTPENLARFDRHM